MAEGTLSLNLAHAALILRVLGLMVAVAGSAVEAEYLVKGGGRWWVGLLWLVGLVITIFGAGRNRRVIVTTVLRGVVVLVVMGAIAQLTLSASVAAIVSIALLLLVEKLWPNRLRKNSPGLTP